MSRRLGFLLLACGAALCTTLAFAPMASAAGHQPAIRQQYYLSLGDSLGYGYQAVKLTPTPVAASFDTGYTDDLAKLVRLVKPGIVVENFSCPGETSTTMIDAGCPWTLEGAPLHNTYAGAQLTAAEVFLEHHSVPLVTLSIGANDVLPDTASCLGGSSCPALAGDLATLHANLTRILSGLHAANPAATIIVLTPYNPFGKAYPSSNALAVQLDLTIAGTALSNHARIADAFVPFNVAPKPGLCALSYYCTNDDIHPTDRGYQVIANRFFLSWLI